MTIPVLLKRSEGRFTASILGSPQYVASGDSREGAVAALVSDLGKIEDGELLFVEVPAKPGCDSALYTEDDLRVLRELTTETYRIRDEQKRQEFPG